MVVSLASGRESDRKTQQYIFQNTFGTDGNVLVSMAIA